MAAIEMELGLEHGNRGWGQQRPELMDNFDSEMQEWEDQLQDIQRKIEELYHDVQARRGANENPADTQKNSQPSYHGNCLFPPGHHRVNHPGAINVHPHYSNGCNNDTNGYSYPGNHQNGYGHCHPNNVSKIENLLQDYLEKGKPISRKNGVRHVHFSDTINVSQDAALKDKVLRASEDERFRQDKCLGGIEGTENKKNRASHSRSSPNKENTGAKPPLAQRDVPSTQGRSQLPVTTAESPAMERKSFGPGVLGERKCNSPSVLRKFGAMLHENEGKTLTDSGVVTNQGSIPEAKCPTPGCQRRALGASAVTGKVPMRVPTQRGQADSEVLTADIEPGQEWGLALDSCRQNYKDQRGGYSSPKVSQPSPQTQRRPQVAGSPKLRPRANSGADRDGAPPARKPVVQHVDPKKDYRVSCASPSTQRIQRGGLVEKESLSCGQVMDEGLIELLDMLEIQHEYGSNVRTGMGYSSYRQEPQQVTPPELSTKPRKSFSRPARPANQRPPSRWASQTPSARITTPSGPIYRPPSPRTRTPSPMTRTSSPALKQRPTISYSLQTETVIM